MEFTGRIHIREVERKPLEIKGTEADKWVRALLAQAAPDTVLTGLTPDQWAAEAKLTTEVRVEKMTDQYIVSGSFEASVRAPCSRCSDLFTTPRKSQFRLLLQPIAGRRQEKEEGDSGDADFVFFKSDYINLVDLLAEQVIVQEPVAECPARKADGSCTLCGENPQFGVEDELQNPEKTAGQEVDYKAFSAFSADLGKLKKD